MNIGSSAALPVLAEAGIGTDSPLRRLFDDRDQSVMDETNPDSCENRDSPSDFPVAPSTWQCGSRGSEGSQAGKADQSTEKHFGFASRPGRTARLGPTDGGAHGVGAAKAL